jgi:hypothetical protein
MRGVFLQYTTILYLLGLLGGPYSFILHDFGIDIKFNTRDGPFFTTLFFATGWFLSSGKFFIKPRYLKWREKTYFGRIDVRK